MKRTLLVSYGLLLLTSIGYSQRPEELLNQWYKKSPIEKVYLHVGYTDDGKGPKVTIDGRKLHVDGAGCAVAQDL